MGIDYLDIPASHLDPTLSIYRKTTIAFLRKYFRMATELGHLPSLIGMEFFRSRVSSYRTFSFEDTVIFTHDVERCLDRLPKKLQLMIARIVFQEYTYRETAQLAGCSLMSVRRWYLEAIDRLTDIFLRNRLLEPIKLARLLEIAKELGEFGESEIPLIEEYDDGEVLDDLGREEPISLLPPKKPPVPAVSAEQLEPHEPLVKCC